MFEQINDMYIFSQRKIDDLIIGRGKMRLHKTEGDYFLRDVFEADKTIKMYFEKANEIYLNIKRENSNPSLARAVPETFIPLRPSGTILNS